MLWSLPEGKHQRTLPRTGVVLGTAFTDAGAVLWLRGDRGVQRLEFLDEGKGVEPVKGK